MPGSGVVAKTAAEVHVDGLGHAGGGREVGVADLQDDELAAPEVDVHLPLDEGTVGDSSDRRMVLRLGRPAALSLDAETTHGNGSLRHGVDLTVMPAQGRHDQRSPRQTLGIAEAADGDVDGVSCARECGQLSGDDDRGDVLEFQPPGIDTNAHSAEHRDDGLNRETRLVGVAGAVQADDHTVADELIRANPANVGEVFDAGGFGGTAEEEHTGSEQECGDSREHGFDLRKPVLQAAGQDVQKGQMKSSAFENQPFSEPRVRLPRPVNSICASAMRLDNTVLSWSMSIRRMTPLM